jgi:Na+-transporting methylmalonyl-CoA/oxaloacetate decarboxylase gamma subunit
MLALRSEGEIIVTQAKMMFLSQFIENEVKKKIKKESVKESVENQNDVRKEMMCVIT